MIKKILSISRLSLKYIWLNIKYNFFSNNIIRHNGAHIYIYRDVIIDIDNNSSIELYGDLDLGVKSIRDNRQISKFYMAKNSYLHIERKCDILDGFDIQIHKNGKLFIERFHANVGLEISCGNEIMIKDDVVAGRHVRIKDFNGHEVSYEAYPLSAPIEIHRHVWLCTGCTINPGVKIGEGSVIADNANVVDNIPPATFNQGNPSIIKKEGIIFQI